MYMSVYDKVSIMKFSKNSRYDMFYPVGEMCIALQKGLKCLKVLNQFNYFFLSFDDTVDTWTLILKYCGTCRFFINENNAMHIICR